jgi:hypothetical protein
MKLKEQVCSLGLAQKLKELGVKQESLHYWLLDSTHKNYFIVGDYYIDWKCEFYIQNSYSAFTVAELGEVLLATGCHFTFSGNTSVIEIWCCHRYNGNVSTKVVNDISEADCRAKMLIWCIENGASPS